MRCTVSIKWQMRILQLATVILYRIGHCPNVIAYEYISNYFNASRCNCGQYSLKIKFIRKDKVTSTAVTQK